MLNFNTIPLDDPKTWELIQSGRTVGCFQIESQLGSMWCKRIKPENIGHLSDITALIRPACLQGEIDGKSIAQHYADRKNGAEAVVCIDKSMEPVLNNTFGLMVYQEDAMAVSKLVAGFDNKDANQLRKSVAKKKPEEMSKVKVKFIDGATKTNIVSPDVAEEIFDVIEKSQRYSFVKCLNPNTIVDTKEGPKSLEELLIGSHVYCPNLITKQDEYVEVVNKYNNGEQELYEIMTETGKTIECTLSHKFLSEGGKIISLLEIIEQNIKIMCEEE